MLLGAPAWIAVAASPSHAADPTVQECLSSSDRATALRSEGRYRDARKSFLACVAESCPAIVRRDCVTSLTELDQLQPSFVFAVRDERGADMSEVRVLVDGELLVERLDGKPVNVDVGSHVFTFTAGPRYREQRVSVLARTTEKNRVLPVTMDPIGASTPAPPASGAAAPATQPSAAVPVLPIVLGAVGVVALGSFAYLGLSAKSDLRALEDDPCAIRRTCAQSDVDSVRTRFALADVALGVGVVSLAAATWLWLARDGAQSTARAGGRAVPLDLRVRF
ncbi:MAG: hypothetical protein JWP87_4556 [Labilithrix sp.]|nr:hypothetical protein [Labilithrix sp.]